MSETISTWKNSHTIVEQYLNEALAISMNSIRHIAERIGLRKMSSNSGTEIIDLEHFYRHGRKILGAALNYK